MQKKNTLNYTHIYNPARETSGYEENKSVPVMSASRVVGGRGGGAGRAGAGHGRGDGRLSTGLAARRGGGAVASHAGRAGRPQPAEGPQHAS